MDLRRWGMVVFGLGVAWIAGFTAFEVDKDLQQDFGVFYSAGVSLQDGFSPYENNMEKDPRTWDANPYTISGLLYPPLAARFFVPISRLPYHEAKLLWSLLVLAFLALSLVLTTRVLWPGGPWQRHLLVLGVGCFFFPTVWLVHNGNVDSLTMVLLSLGFFLAYRYDRPWAYGAYGACIACAILFKLDILLLVPGIFLLRWRPLLVGLMLGALALGATTLALDGPDLNKDYLFKHLGRIFHRTSDGDKDQEISLEKLRQNSPGYPDLYRKDGRDYRMGFPEFQYLCSASGTRVIAAHSGGQRTLVMVLVPLVLWGLAYAAVRTGKGVHPTVAFYFFGLLIGLFCAPFTWTQRMVWVLPMLPWLLWKLGTGPGARTRTTLWAGIACLVMIGLPVPLLKGLGFYYGLFTLLLMAVLWRVLRLGAAEPALG